MLSTSVTPSKDQDQFLERTDQVDRRVILLDIGARAEGRAHVRRYGEADLNKEPIALSSFGKCASLFLWPNRVEVGVEKSRSTIHLR